MYFSRLEDSGSLYSEACSLPSWHFLALCGEPYQKKIKFRRSAARFILLADHNRVRNVEKAVYVMICVYRVANRTQAAETQKRPRNTAP